MAKAFPNTGVTIIDSSSDLTGFSPSEGLMVFQKDTNELKIYDGSAWKSVVDTDTPNGLVHIATNTVTAGTNSSFNNCFSSAFKAYRIIADPYGSFTGGYGGLTFRLRSNGTDSTTSYYTHEWYKIVNNALTSGYISNDSSGRAGYTGNLGTLLTMDLINPFLAKNTMFLVSSISFNNTDNIATQQFGMHYIANSYDGITFAIGTGTFTGDISIYGYRNS